MDESMSMGEIANRLGYDSLTYFERVFKKQMTVSPLQYRKSVLKVQ
jgi:AraC-like DNA-binding protein